MTSIQALRAREILDSRGNPAVEVMVSLSDGTVSVASTPSGASIGIYEAVELRDGGDRFGGMGVLKAISNIHGKIAPALEGMSPYEQEQIDNIILEIDGTDNKSNLGANATLGVSIAIARAAAESAGSSMYKYLSIDDDSILPVPMFNVLNGGRHSNNSVDFQEFMVVPAGVQSFAEALRAGAEVYKALGNILEEKGLSTNVGDEGGFAPEVKSNREAIDLLCFGIERAGYELGVECYVSVDVAAAELYKNGRYELIHEGLSFNCREFITFLEATLSSEYVVSIEDPFTEDDWDCWSTLTTEMGGKCQIVGDDLFTTNASRIKAGMKNGVANAVLIKPNQIGTLTETIEAVHVSKECGWGTVMSHRSGETEDTSIADLSVAWSLGQIKAGAPVRGERTVKYNRLLLIEQELGDKATYGGDGLYEN